MNFKINTTTYLRGRPPAASASCRFHAPFSLFVRRQRVSVRVAVRRPPVRRRTVRHAREGTRMTTMPARAVGQHFSTSSAIYEKQWKKRREGNATKNI